MDNIIVFCTEIIPEFAEIYDRMFLESPSLKTVCFIIRISCLLYLLHIAMPEFSLKATAILAAIHGTLLICVPIISDNDWMVYFYYFPSQFVIICVCIWALIRLTQLRQNYEAQFVRKFRKVIIYFLVMTTLVLLEDTFVIFYVDVYSGPGLKIFNRNFSENVLFIGFALAIVGYCVNYLKELSKLSLSTFSEREEHDSLSKMDPVRQFSAEYGLTEREQEILRCVLEEKSQQEISDTLLIALGTVKTHTHNIYRKTDSANRNQIIVRFQEFCDQQTGCEPKTRAIT